LWRAYSGSALIANDPGPLDTITRRGRGTCAVAAGMPVHRPATAPLGHGGGPRGGRAAARLPRPRPAVRPRQGHPRTARRCWPANGKPAGCWPATRYKRFARPSRDTREQSRKLARPWSPCGRSVRRMPCGLPCLVCAHVTGTLGRWPTWPMFRRTGTHR
jgi:hypothetical protein